MEEEYEDLFGNYADFQIIHRKGNLIVKAIPETKKVALIGILGLFWAFFIALFIGAVVYFRLPQDLILYSGFVTLPFAYIMMRKMARKVTGVTILTINREQDIFFSHIDQFKEKLSDIIGFSVTDDVVKQGKKDVTRYRITYQLNNDNRTSPFAFTTYETVEELLRQIRPPSNEQ